MAEANAAEAFFREGDWTEASGGKAMIGGKSALFEPQKPQKMQKTEGRSGGRMFLVLGGYVNLYNFHKKG